MERGDNFRRFVPPTVSEEHVAFENEVWRVVNGSQLYGTATNSSDQDQIGVFIEPLEYVVGFKKMDHYEWRNAAEGERASAGDMEITLYSLRKFMNLLIQGNPSILCTIFAPDNLVLVNKLDLRSLQSFTASKKPHPRFKGYLHSQLERMQGIKKGHKAQREELVEAYGYDTKFAMHAIRLGMQGCEYLQTGKISSPSKDAHTLLAIREGRYTEEQCIEWCGILLNQLDIAYETSPLPEEPNYDVLAEWMIDTHMTRWNS